MPAGAAAEDLCDARRTRCHRCMTPMSGPLRDWCREHADYRGQYEGSAASGIGTSAHQISTAWPCCRGRRAQCSVAPSCMDIAR